MCTINSNHILLDTFTVQNVPDDSYDQLVAGWEKFFKNRGSLELGWSLGPETPLIPFKFCKSEHLLDHSKKFGICVRFSADPKKITDLIVESTSVNGIPEQEVGCLFYPSETRVPELLCDALALSHAFETKNPEIMDVYLVSYLLSVAFKDEELRRSLVHPIMVRKNSI